MSQADDLLGAILGMQMLQKELLRQIANDAASAEKIIERAAIEVDESGSCYSSGAISYLESLAASLRSSPLAVTALQ